MPSTGVWRCVCCVNKEVPKVWGKQAAHGSASTDLAPAFSRIPPLGLPRSVPSRVRVRTCSMRCAPQLGVLSILVI